MTEELIIREMIIDEAAGRGDSDSRMTNFEVIMPLKHQSTRKVLLCCIFSAGNSWKRMGCSDEGKMARILVKLLIKISVLFHIY